VRRNTLLIDAVIAASLVVIVLIVSPGLAVTGLIALLILAVCLVSFMFERWRRRRTKPPRGRPRQQTPQRRAPRAAALSCSAPRPAAPSVSAPPT
jgi:membrane protein implicated in regulation of membrane protease activity